MKKKIFFGQIVLARLLDSCVVVFEISRDGCLDPPARSLGIEIRVLQLIHGRTKSSCQASLKPMLISQFCISFKNHTRQMFIQVVYQPSCFVFSLAM